MTISKHTMKSCTHVISWCDDNTPANLQSGHDLVCWVVLSLGDDVHALEDDQQHSATTKSRDIHIAFGKADPCHQVKKTTALTTRNLGTGLIGANSSFSTT